MQMVRDGVKVGVVWWMVGMYGWSRDGARWDGSGGM